MTGPGVSPSPDQAAQRGGRRFPVRPSIVLFLVWALLLLAYLPRVGATWDEPKWFDFGRRLGDYVLGRTKVLRDDSNNFYYGALPAFATQVAHGVFHRRLGLLSPDDAYHMAGFGWAAALVLGIVLWAGKVYGEAGACLALVLWMLLPRLWPDSVANISDLPGAAGALWAARAAWRISVRPAVRHRDWIILGAAVGALYSLRAPNAYFFALALLAWHALSRWVLGHRWPALGWRGPLLSLAFFLLTVKALNPWLWHESAFLRVFWTNPLYYASGDVGRLHVWFDGAFYRAGTVPRWYFPLMWLRTTPLLPMAAFAAALAALLGRRARLDQAGSLWLVLWLVGFGKHLTGLGNYDGVRHAMEIYAPQTLLAAGGALWLWGMLRRAPVLRWAAILLAVLGAAEPALTAARVFPYLTGYFNPLAGRLARAWADNEPDYFGYSFPEGSRWVRSHAPRGSRVYVPYAGHLAARRLEPDYPVVSRFAPSRLDEAPPGSLLMILGRRGAFRRAFRTRGPVACPDGWETAHAVTPDDGLPPLMLICRRPEPAAKEE